MTAEQIRVLLVEDVPQVAAHVRALLVGQSQIKMIEVIDAGERAVAAVNQLRPDIVLVDALLQGTVRGMQVAAELRRDEPGVGVVVVTVPQHPVQPDPERGIDAVLAMPFSSFDLTTTLRKLHEARAQETSHPGSLTVSLFSPKGGVGRTTLAYNLAVAAAEKRRVCLVDGSIQFGDLRSLLRVPPTAASILDLPTDRITESDLRQVTWRDPSGIDILLAPPRIEMAEMLTVGDLEKVLSILRQLYEFVVIDTRAGLQDDVLAFLDASDVVLLLVTGDRMAMRSVTMAMEAFGAIGYPASKVLTVLNRSDGLHDMRCPAVQEALGRAIDHEVASDYAVVGTANNEGVPFVISSPDAAITLGVRRLVEALTARAGQPSASVAGR